MEENGDRDTCTSCGWRIKQMHSLERERDKGKTDRER